MSFISKNRSHPRPGAWVPSSYQGWCSPKSCAYNLTQQLSIGTDTPSVKLHVDGGDAVISDKLGIGTTDPKTELHVVGDLALGKDEDNKRFIFHSRKDNNGDYLQITYDKSNGTLEAGKGITLQRGGNVGINNTNPQTTFDVNGADSTAPEPIELSRCSWKC